MSCLTKMLSFDRARVYINSKGEPDQPILLTCSLPPELGDVVISIRDGSPHQVRIVSQRLSRSAFFPLKEEEEDAYHANLVHFLYELGTAQKWGGVTDVNLPTPEVLDDVARYFKAYETNASRVFVGMVGFTALLVQGLLTLPEEVEILDTETITVDDLNTWMDEYFHVGKVESLPVFFNPHMANYILFCARPKQVGQMSRSKETVAIMLHNAERGCCILKVECPAGSLP